MKSDGSEHGPRPVPGENPAPARPPAGNRTVRPAPARGGDLCSTCSRRDGCPKRDTEGGVWRCPDYEE
jgi:hypothetical protein